jgi:hypothetical protein
LEIGKAKSKCGGTENQSTGRVTYINQYILGNSDLPMTCVNFCRILRLKNTDNSYFIYSLFEYLYKRKVLFNWENGTTGIKNLNLKALLKDFDLAIFVGFKKRIGAFSGTPIFISGKSVPLRQIVFSV